MSHPCPCLHSYVRPCVTLWCTYIAAWCCWRHARLWCAIIANMCMRRWIVQFSLTLHWILTLTRTKSFNFKLKFLSFQNKKNSLAWVSLASRVFHVALYAFEGGRFRPSGAFCCWVARFRPGAARTYTAQHQPTVSHSLICSDLAHCKLTNSDVCSQDGRTLWASQGKDIYQKMQINR